MKSHFYLNGNADFKLVVLFKNEEHFSWSHHSLWHFCLLCHGKTQDIFACYISAWCHYQDEAKIVLLSLPNLMFFFDSS